MKKVYWFAIAALLLGTWLTVPTTDIVSPAWDVLVTDLQGQPLEGAHVSDDSQQYTFEEQSTDLDATTGVDGRVHFKSRFVRVNGWQRIVGVVRNLNQGVHASFGVHTWIFASKVGYGEPAKLEVFTQNNHESTFHGGSYQSSHLKLQKCSPGYHGIGCSFPDDVSMPVLPLHKNDQP